MKKQSLLWKISSKESAVSHYLFGTMHLSTSAAYSHAEKAKKYISKLSVYAAEMDLNQTLDKNMIQYFKLPEGIKLSSLYIPRHFEKFKKTILKSFNIDITQYDDFSPFFISTLLAESVIPKSHGKALDHFLWDHAFDLGLTMKGVESFEDQLNILNQIPMNYQIKALKDIVRNTKVFKSKIKKLHSLYEIEDIESLNKQTKKSVGRIRKLMIYDRNHIMVERMISMMKEKPTFFAIGAAHMSGGKGLISLMKKAGYKLEPVME
jgi:hypothetical protein